MFPISKFHAVIFCFFLILGGCGGNNESQDASKEPGAGDDPGALTKSAIKKQEIGAFEEAVEILNKALQIDSQFVPAHYRMGLVYEEWDRRPEAIQAYKKALTIDANHEGARLGLASVHSKSNRNDLAIQEYNKVAVARPDDPELHFKIALEYWYIQKLPESAEHYRKVIAINPDHIQAHLNLASVYEKMKDWEKAIEEIAIAIRLGKENKDEQAIAIAERKLQRMKGRKDLTDKVMDRITQPPFE